MKNTIFTALRIFLGIISVIIITLGIAVLCEVIQIKSYILLKWVHLLICMLGFYVSGLINRKTSLKLIPFLYISLLIFVYLQSFYVPFIFLLILFATISLLLTRKEFNKKVKIISSIMMIGTFLFFLFSQPLEIVEWGKPMRLDQYGNLIDGKIIWDFSEKEAPKLPESVFLDLEDEPFDLISFKDKKLYITFWATWCVPCRQEKTQLEKLKAYFKDNTDIVFIDISLDSNKEKWKKHVKEKQYSGIQLISNSQSKTRSLFGIWTIPTHFIVNSKHEFVKVNPIEDAYNLLEDSIYLNKFFTGELPKRIKWSDITKE